MKREPCKGPFRAQAFCLPITWASARGARFSPGYNIAGLQPSESAYDLSHLGKVLDKVTCSPGPPWSKRLSGPREFRCVTRTLEDPGDVILVIVPGMNFATLEPFANANFN